MVTFNKTNFRIQSHDVTQTQPHQSRISNLDNQINSTGTAKKNVMGTNKKQKDNREIPHPIMYQNPTCEQFNSNVYLHKE